MQPETPADTCSSSDDRLIDSLRMTERSTFVFSEEDFLHSDAIPSIELTEQSLVDGDIKTAKRPQRMTNAKDRRARKTQSRIKGKSRRSKKQQELVSRFGVDGVGLELQIKGRVRPRVGGHLEWYDTHEDIWRVADYHHVFRQELLGLDGLDAPYKTTPSSGKDECDQTGNCEVLDQHQWQFCSEADLDAVVDAAGQHVFRQDHCTSDPETWPKRELWFHKGILLLNMNNQPLHYWNCIPRCLSSSLEGGRMEAFRRVFPWLRTEDYRDRMPATLTKGSGSRASFGLSTLRHRTSRFRNAWGFPAWQPRSAPSTERSSTSANSETGTNAWSDGMTRSSISPRPECGTTDLLALQIDMAAASAIPTGILELEETLELSMLYTTPMADPTIHENYTIGPDGNLCVCTNLGELIDLRYYRPQNHFQEEAIQQALAVTRCDYLRRTGYRAPSTRRMDSYAEQVDKMRHAMVTLLDGFGEACDDLGLWHISEPWFGTFTDKPRLQVPSSLWQTFQTVWE